MRDIPANEHAVETTTVPASVEDCFKVGLDLESYPEWAEGIALVEVIERDADDRPLKARFEVAGLGRETSYVLAYDLSGAPGRMSWALVEGDLIRRLEGTYLFEPEGTGETHVTYELYVDLVVPLPGFVKRRAEDKILAAALQRFKTRVLAVAG